MRLPLTARQNQAFEFIRDYLHRHRLAPTHQEIGDALGLKSTNAIYKILKALEQKGYIERPPHKARSLRLVDPQDDPFSGGFELPTLPLISRVSSTDSTLPDDLRRSNRRFTVDYFFLNGADPDACLFGRAGDDGMNRDGIRKGDYLVIEECLWRDLRADTLGAFLVGPQLLIRRFAFANHNLLLRPSDTRAYDDGKFPPDTDACYVIGRVRSLLRRF
jgi:repressor LexA